MVESETFRFEIAAENSGGRIDQTLVSLLAQVSSRELSRSQIQRLFERGLVTLNDQKETRTGYRVRPGDVITVVCEAAESGQIEPQEMPLSVLFEDDHLMCINKPPALSVHPGAGRRDGTLLNALAHYLKESPRSNSQSRPWIVHRLDKDTSGVLLVAKTEVAHRELSEQFQQRQVEKEYRALVLGTPRMKNVHLQPDSGTIDQPIGRHPTERTRMAILPDKGRASRTNWAVVERFEYGSLLSVEIETGRTHQIRVHFESVGAPVIGDTVYGNFNALPKTLLRLHQQFGRQALHAFRISCDHPVSKERVSFEAPVPQDMRQLIDRWREYNG